jgi:hypothetical protein
MAQARQIKFIGLSERLKRLKADFLGFVFRSKALEASRLVAKLIGEFDELGGESVE